MPRRRNTSPRQARSADTNQLKRLGQEVNRMAKQARRLATALAGLDKNSPGKRRRVTKKRKR